MNFFLRKLIIISVYKEIQVISFRINDIYIVQTKLLCSPNLVHLISLLDWIGNSMKDIQWSIWLWRNKSILTLNLFHPRI
jgi:hypothetical protein